MMRACCRVSGILLIAIMLALGIMAQASATDVRPFSDIQATPITVTPDPSGRSALLETDTTVDVACSVVYGEDTTFGNITTDTDMAGGGHRHHHPVMSGLQPDTVYQYRFQGTAADGTIYVSDVMSFRTPPAPVGAAPDLALNATVTGVSSEFSDAFKAANAFDGDPSTQWSSRGDGDNAWVEIDLGSTEAISEVIFHSRSMSDGSAITHTFSITADGVQVGVFPADVSVPLDIKARNLRFDVVSSSGGNTGASEIVVLGQAQS